MFKVTQLSKIKHLRLTEELLSQETDFSFFREFKNIHHLEIDSIYDLGHLLNIPFDKLSSLKELFIYDCYVTDLLALLPNSIEKLEIRDYDENFVQKQIIGDAIGRFQNLKALTIESPNIIDISLKLGVLHNLQNLWLRADVCLPKEIKQLKIEFLGIEINYEKLDINFLPLLVFFTNK